MNHKAEPSTMRFAANARAYAIGQYQTNGFRIRRVVWGRTLANAERRPDEKIVRAIVMVDCSR